MPYAPARHKPQGSYDPSKRATASARGYGRRWQKARKAFLAEHPLCVRCMVDGLTEAASVVDHVRPHRGDPVLFWDWSNWQALCKHHHDVKTMTEDARVPTAPASRARSR